MKTLKRAVLLVMCLVVTGCVTINVKVENSGRKLTMPMSEETANALAE